MLSIQALGRRVYVKFCVPFKDHCALFWLNMICKGFNFVENMLFYEIVIICFNFMLQARRESPKAVDKFLKLALVLDNSMVGEFSYNSNCFKISNTLLHSISLFK